MRNARQSLGTFLLSTLCLILSSAGIAAESSRFFPETGETSNNAFYRDC